MNELLYYDTAAIDFYNSLQIKGLPLNSWDLYAEYYDDLLKSAIDIQIFERLSKEFRWKTPLDIKAELLQKKRVIVVTDVQLKIIHASHNMTGMNGYTIDEVVGRSPKMFQGEETCPTIGNRISDAIKNREPFEETVLNYRKNGSTYRCWIKAHPIFNAKKEVVHFIAYEKQVA